MGVPLTVTSYENVPDASVSPALREQWRTESVESVWLRPNDWYHPAVDAVVEAVVAGMPVDAPVARLGEVRGATGVGITEAIDDLICLYRSAGGDAPPAETIRALCEGWAHAHESSPAFTECMDPESALGTVGYLAMRLTEVYGEAARQGTSATETHCLTIVDVESGENAPWRRMARSAAMGRALTTVYGAGHPMARLSGGVFVALVQRDAYLGADVRMLRAVVGQEASSLGVADFTRQPPRIWIESLPATHELAVALLSQLHR